MKPPSGCSWWRRVEHVNDQGGRGRLPVATGHSDAVLQAHDLGQHLGAGNDGNLPGLRFQELRIGGADRGRVDEDVCVFERSFTGIGFSGNFVGPWRTVINLSYGYALASDIAAIEGNDEFLVLIFKLF